MFELVKMSDEEAMKMKSKYKLRKLLEQIQSIKGRHTELVTVYIPAGANLHDIVTTLRQEQGTADNIKSKPVRKNVVSALEKIVRHLGFYRKTPENGLAVFCGNTSEKEGASDITIWPIEPPEPIKTKLYWCDQQFVVDPLMDMVSEKEIYGIICMDKNEADIALLKGKKIEGIAHFESIVPGKTRAGGQCLAPETLIQMADGTLMEINKVSNPHIIKSVDFPSTTLNNRPVIEKWETKKDTKYIITTKCPTTQIESSKDHLFFTWGDRIEEVAAENLKKGDFLLLPEKINIEGEIQSLNSSGLYNSYSISEKGRDYIKNRRVSLKLLQKELAKKSKVTQTAISVLELGKRDIKIDFLEILCRHLETETSSFIRQFCAPNSNLKLPEVLDENLANFLGYFAGDGSFENERISLFDADKQTIDYYSNLAKIIFNCNSVISHRQNKGHFVARIYGKPIVKLLRSEFHELKYALNTEIPCKILKSTNSVLAAFLRGLFDAEGYVNMERGIGLGINNKKMAQQVQLTLLRFGILASLVEYDNRRNPYSKKHRFTIGITERKSLELFLSLVGFNTGYKMKKLKKVITNKSRTSYTRQIFLTGENIRKIIESEGHKVSDFKKVTNFFRNERLMSKDVFRSSILSEVKNNENLYKKLAAVLDYNLIPLKISSIRKIEEETSFVDIEVKNSNFIANGLVVHNSSARFSRIREGLLNDWMKHVAEAANKIFAEHKEVIGIIISGSGPIKEMMFKEDYLHAEIKNRIIGVVDTSYTGDHGLHETLVRGEDLLKETAMTKEKKLLQKFLTELQKPNGLAVYGLENVIQYLESGNIDKIVLCENIDKRYIELECQCGMTKAFLNNFEKNKQICKTCNRQQKILGDMDLIDFFEEKIKDYGSTLVIVTRDTREGEQFFQLGGIGGFLRYRT